MSSRFTIGCAALAIAASSRAASDPIVLRGDALATTTAPAGLLTLTADGDAGPTTSAEASVWTGRTTSTAADRADGDVLVIALHARTVDGRVSGTLGRFVAILGALRPVHVDGLAGRLRLPQRVDVEIYGGVPVEPDLATSRAWDWVTGGRVSRRFGDWGSAGVAYLQQRDDGRVASEEIGVDAGAAVGERDDVAGKLAYDLANPGFAEATLTASDRRGAVRSELYGTYIAASHLLPATSLFTVLGDVPSVRVGGVVTWRAAPRLDVISELAIRRSDGDAIDGAAPTSSTSEAGEVLAPEVRLRATLRLDARGASAIGGEIRRDGGGDSGWTGARATARIAMPHAFALSGELELVVPDRDLGLGRAWPWAIVAVSRTWGAWHAAAAVEAQSSPEDRSRLDALVELGRTWSLR